MAQLLNEIAWEEPIFPVVAEPQWEAEVKRRAGRVSEVLSRLTPLHWLRAATLDFETYRLTRLPPRLKDIGAVVTAQENACRYCYGATRAYLRLLGYSEAKVGRIEREAQLAELDEKDRAYVEFCRSLARSRPRPARAEYDRLLQLGYPPEMVAEMAYLIAGCCFYNRVATFLACPPEVAFERFAGGPLGRMISLFGPVIRTVQTVQAKRAKAEAPAAVAPGTPFAAVCATLPGGAAVEMLQRALQGAFESTVLPARTKALMFAVVARSLDCSRCGDEAKRIAVAAGLEAEEVERCLAELGSPALDPFEAHLLDWVRDTVHYEPSAVQQRTRELVAQIGELRTLEAIGVASLANATVRLAMLLE